MGKKRQSGEGSSVKRLLYVGARGVDKALDYDVVVLEKGIKPWETGFPKNHFDMIVADCALEKIQVKDVLRCINEWTRILKSGGTLQIIAANLRWAVAQAMRSDYGQNWVPIQAVIYGTQQDEDEIHRSGYTLEIMRGLLEEIGYKIKVATIIPWPIYHGENLIEAERILVAGIKGIK